MDVHASPAEWPELQDCLGAFQVRCRRPEGGQALERSMTGRLTALPHQHCETLAQAVPSTNAPRRQACRTNRPWGAEELNRQRVAQMLAAVALGDGVLGLEDTGFPTQGKTSVGVARQDSGTLGKVGNGPMAVTCGDTDGHATWPVAGRLYRPQAWAEDHARRGRARVPEEVTGQTTPEMAVARRAQARAWGVPHRCVVAEAGDGDTPHVLAALEARQER